jgi:hypothetical protein
MAFELFVGNPRKERVARNPRVEESVAKFIAGPSKTVLLILSTNTVHEFGFAPEDRINLLYDKTTRRVGIVKHKDGLVLLGKHGASEKVLKGSVTRFFNSQLGHLGLSLPFKADVERGKRGMLVFSVRRNKIKPAAKPVKAATKIATNGNGKHAKATPVSIPAPTVKKAKKARKTAKATAQPAEATV